VTDDIDEEDTPDLQAQLCLFLDQTDVDITQAQVGTSIP
jgi:hypothetical protein